MSRALRDVGLWSALFLLLSTVLVAQSNEPTAVRLERAQRERLRLVEAGEWEHPVLVDAIEAADWVERANVLEFLVRLVQSGVKLTPNWARRVERAQSHAHPNVRERALLVTAYAPEVGFTPPAGRPDWPPERAALAANGWRDSFDETLLFDCMNDADERVRRRAFGAWVARARDAAFVVRTAQNLPEERADELLRAARFLELEDAKAPSEPWLAGLVVLVGGAGAEDADSLVETWREVPTRLHPRLVDAVKSAGDSLASALFRALLKTDDEELGRFFSDAWSHAESSDRRLERLVDCGLDRVPTSVLADQFATLEPKRIPPGALAWREAGWSADLTALFVDVCERADVARDEPARAWLASVLGQEEVEAVAFRALAKAPGDREPELFTAWQELPIGERLVRLGWFDLDERLPSFRDELLKLGEGRTRLRNFAARSLAPFRGDDGVRVELERWLASDWAAFEAQLVDPAAKPRPSIERRILEVARALFSVDRERAEELLPRWLQAAGQRSDELGKELAALLGKSPRRVELLAPLLDASVRSRTRVEAALRTVPEPRAIDVLLELEASLGPDLRARVMERLASADEDRVSTRLAVVAREATAPELVRVAAVESLGAHARGAARLVRLAQEARYFPVRRRALVTLGRLGDLTGVRELVERLGLDPVRPDDPPEFRQLLTGEFRVLQARVGLLGAQDLGYVFEAAVRSFADDLVSRLDGQRGAAADFRWRAELVLAGHLGFSALEDVSDWRATDGALLAALARLDTGPPGITLSRAAVVALEGQVAQPWSIARERVALGWGLLARRELEAAGRVLRALQMDFASRELPLTLLVDAFGSFDVDRVPRRDPLARFRDGLRRTQGN